MANTQDAQTWGRMNLESEAAHRHHHVFPVPSLFPLMIGLVMASVVTSLSLAVSKGASWGQPIELSTPPGPAQYPQLVLDPTSGDQFCAWTDQGLGGWTEILGRRWERASGSWSPVENLSQSEWEDRSPLLFFDGRGWGLLIWTRRYAASQGAPADGTDLLWRSWDGSGWSEEGVLTHEDFALPGAYGLIPVETPDSILLFITYNNSYRLTEYRAGIWSERGIWSELSPWEYLTFQDPVVNPALAQVVWDERGVLHAAAFGENSSQQGFDAYFRDAYYLTYDGLEWSKPLNLSATDGVASDLGMAFDREGRLHFLWSDPDSVFSSESAKSAIWERVYEDGSWSTDNTEVTVYNEAQAIADLDLTTDASGTLHLAWSEGLLVDFGHSELNMHYLAGDGATWGAEERVYSSTSNSRYPSLVVTADDGVALAWEERSPSGEHILYSRRVAGVLHLSYLPLISK